MATWCEELVIHRSLPWRLKTSTRSRGARALKSHQHGVVDFHILLELCCQRSLFKKITKRTIDRHLRTNDCTYGAFSRQMASFNFSLTVAFTFAIVDLLCGFGMGFLGDSRKLDFKLNLTLEPKHVTRARSENVKLRCEPGSSQSVQLEKFTLMRILKQNLSDDTENTWVSILEKKDVDVKNAVLEFVWPRATSEALGVYRCDAIGFTPDASIVSGNTPNIEIKMDEVTVNDVLDVLRRAKARLQDEVSYNTVEIGELNDKLDGLIEEERNRSGVIDERLAASEHVKEAVVHRLLFPENPWPSGQYALLQPDTGCPLGLNFYGGHTGYFTIHGESSQGTRKTFANTKTYLSKPVVTTSGSEVFLTLKFCVSNTMTNNLPWPKGEYCIHSADGNCPEDFSTGIIRLDTEDTNNQDAKGGNHPSNVPSDLRFCCTKSGVHSTPMVLPTEKPFYLYRQQNPCQAVAGMNVTIDYFEVGVESRYNTVSGEHPYTVLKTNSRRFEVCYYSKK